MSQTRRDGAKPRAVERAEGPAAVAPWTTPQEQAWGDAAQPTLASYFKAFSPVPSWDDLCTWPPDVFALCNLVLDHTESYRFAVSPHNGRRWPPGPEWNEQVLRAARAWRPAARPTSVGPIPEAVAAQWEIVTTFQELPLDELRHGRAPSLCAALLTLHAMADEACASLGPEPDQPFERHAWHMLTEHGSLSRIAPARLRILPKTHFPSRGITIRSFSRYLALSYEAINLRWRRVESDRPPPEVGQLDFNGILVPWPFRVESRAFRPVSGPLDNMDPGSYGFFEFAPDIELDLPRIARLVDTARATVGRVDALILPEAAVEPDDVLGLESLLEEKGVRFLFAGVREVADAGNMGRNYIHLAVRGRSGWECYEQTKHNRWCLDEGQIRQYHLTRSLQPAKLWWEAIALPERTIQVIEVGGGSTTVPLICEDLARMDEVSDVLRRLGPTLIIALLLDGPQLTGRWPSRYASILADDPGSAVLTLTSFGMANRSRPPGRRPSRVVAMWNDAQTGTHELELARGASAILLTASEKTTSAWTADGRRHQSPELVLSAVRQLR